LRTTKKDDVVMVDLSYAGYNSAIERLQLRVQFCGVKIMRNWLVKEILADDRRFISVARGKLAPYVD
jgi:hypothetical protein